MRRLATITALPLIATALAGCGLGSSLSTGSILGGGQANAGVPKEPPPITAVDRLAQVAATSARAERCGFNFNPDRLRESFLAAEMSQPGAPSDLAQKYDFTRKGVIAATVSDDTYCTEGRTRIIKADLTRHLAGDYNPLRKQQVDLSGMKGDYDYRSRETVNPELLDDRNAKKTKRVDY